MQGLGNSQRNRLSILLSLVGLSAAVGLIQQGFAEQRSLEEDRMADLGVAGR